MPHTQSAMRRGELSRAQADEIAGAAAANPRAERSLLNSAAGSSLTELRERCARTRAAADADRDATHRRIHRERRVRRWTDSEGAWNLSARGTPDGGSRFNAALNPITDGLFNAARRDGLRESREAYAFALIELARRHTVRQPGATTKATSEPAPTAGTPRARHATTTSAGKSATASATDMPTNEPPAPATMRPVSGPVTHLALLRIDLEALVRGGVEGDELCEITGLGPVPVATARALLGESILKLVITNGSDVANVTHLGRGPTVAQRIALLWSSPGCDVRGCCSTISVQADDRVPWADDRITELANLDHLCAHHHRLKTHRGWGLVPGIGKRPMVRRVIHNIPRTRRRRRRTTTRDHRTGAIAPARGPQARNRKTRGHRRNRHPTKRACSATPLDAPAFTAPRLVRATDRGRAHHPGEKPSPPS